MPGSSQGQLAPVRAVTAPDTQEPNVMTLLRGPRGERGLLCVSRGVPSQHAHRQGLA